MVRKRDKQIATEGQAPRIDMETLRASARAAEAEKSHARAQAQGNGSISKGAGGNTPPTGGGGGEQPTQNQGHHQGSFQVVNMNAGGPPTSGWSTHVGSVNGKGRGGYPAGGSEMHTHSSFLRTTGSRGASPPR